MNANGAVATRRQTCTDHCSGCGRHFSGLAAFDRHLRRAGEGTNRWGAPTYELEHLDGAAAGLEAWTAAGWCDLSQPAQHPVTIWRLPMTEARRASLARMAGREADPGDTPSPGGPEGEDPVS